jgi:protein MAK11
VKDFELFSLAEQPSHKDIILIVACGSDGAVRVWSLNIGAFETKLFTAISSPPRAGKLLGTYETGNRITCMVAFIMQNPQDESLTSDFEAERDEEDGVEGSGSDEADD